jgi:hypothetical protein
MKTWTLFEAVEWLLRTCRDRTAIDARTVLVSLTGAGSDSEPPGDILREAIRYAREQAFDSSPGGWIRVVGEAEPSTDSQATVYLTAQGRAALGRREEALERDPDQQ